MIRQDFWIDDVQILITCSVLEIKPFHVQYWYCNLEFQLILISVRYLLSSSMAEEIVSLFTASFSFGLWYRMPEAAVVFIWCSIWSFWSICDQEFWTHLVTATMKSSSCKSKQHQFVKIQSLSCSFSLILLHWLFCTKNKHIYSFSLVLLCSHSSFCPSNLQ